MIIWGGGAGAYTNTGGIYYPITDTWTATSVGTGCPTARSSHTAVWTGSKMIIWGGYDTANANTGALYDPDYNTWTPTSTGTNCPAGTQGHAAVWAGSEMVVWGGLQSNVGGRYDPVGNSWQPTLTGNGCPFGRDGFTMLWTGGAVILWGGSASAYMNSGGMYRTGHITPPLISGETEGCTHVAETLQSDAHTTYQWAFNGADISGATAQTYQTSVSGTYAVRCTDVNGCEGTSAPYNLSLVFCPSTEVSPTGWPHPLRLVKDAASPTGYYLYFERIEGMFVMYNIYEGNVGTWYSHGSAPGNWCNATVSDLGTGEMRAAVTPTISGNHYYLVAASSTTDEGPSGFDSLGVQIPASQSTCSP